MPRLPRLSPLGIPQHIIQRGNNRQACFNAGEDMGLYVNSLNEYSCKYLVQIHAWVFMSIHVHLLVTPWKQDGVSRMMQSLGRSYVQYFNKRYNRSGTLWEGRFRSCLVESSDYLFQCYRYIELNPVRAGMVNHPADYHWSSYHCNGMGIPSKLITPHELYLGLGKIVEERLENYRGLFELSLEPQVLAEIRDSVNQGRVFGSEHFKDEIENKLHQRVRPGKVGRKPGKCDSDPN